MTELIEKYAKTLPEYTELRAQTNTQKRVGLSDGRLIQNSSSEQSGVCSRVYRNGSYGFAAAPSVNEESIATVLKTARRNAEFLDRKQNLGKPCYPKIIPIRAYYDQEKTDPTTQKYMIDFLSEIDTHITEKYPALISREIISPCLTTEKALSTSDGVFSYSLVPHASLYIILTAEDKDGVPQQLTANLGNYGYFSDVFKNPSDYFEETTRLYEQLMQKCEGVFADAGIKECILHPDLAGILAHEAVGHTTEADFVLSGSVAGKYLNKEVASPLVTMVDFASTAFGKQCPVPIFIDDEGTLAKDVTIIENGILKNYMHSKESAVHFGTEPSGNARAFSFADEPLIRMRNTVILPGESKLDDMIASIDNGYYFVKTGNGQADSTGEFMFGINFGYEIKNGKLGKAVKNTTISGVAFEMLKTVTALSDDMSWCSTGMCGKKQPISVGMGGPAIKCKVNVGGR